MAKPRKSPPTTRRRRSLTATVDAVTTKLEDVRREAQSRLNRAGDLETAIAAGMSKLSEAITAFRSAGPAADELRTLCALVDARDRRHSSEMGAQTGEVSVKQPDAAGSAAASHCSVPGAAESGTSVFEGDRRT